MELLVWLGVIMSLYGVVYASSKTTSAGCSPTTSSARSATWWPESASALALAINGACAHAFAHILYKGLLFMGGGSILFMTGETRMSKLGGLYKKMPWAFFLTLIGGLSISAFPLFSGFVSKSMIIQAGFESHLLWAAFLLNLASIGTFYCNGLKVPYFVWFGQNKCEPATFERAKDRPGTCSPRWASPPSLRFLGCYTPALYNLLPYHEAAMEYHPYSSYHVSESLQILLFTALVFFVLVKLKKIEPHAGPNLDLDWFYRMGGRALLWLARKPVQAIDTGSARSTAWAGSSR